MFIPMRKKNKRAVSEMIGYILLITFAIVIAAIVFSWLKSYIPKEGIACPDGVSIYISDYTYDNAKKELELTLKNNGQFSIGGIRIHYSTNESEEIATNDLSNNITSGGSRLNPGIFLGIIGENSFEPGNEDKILIFDVAGIDYIYAIEIAPIRWQEEKNRNQIVNCANAKTKKILDSTTLSSSEETLKTASLSNEGSKSSRPSTETSEILAKG